MIKEYKEILRKKILEQSMKSVEIKSFIKNASIFIEKLNPSSIGIYFNMENEYDVRPLIFLYPNKQFSFPKLEEDNMDFYECDQSTDFCKHHKYNFFEPIANKKIVPELFFVPGLAFDQKGNRLGFGKGHYDKYFAKKIKLGYKFILIGLCTNGLVDYIPSEPHDIKMEYLIFDSNILKT